MIKNYIKRDIFDSLVKHLSKKEITMIIGPRQCGKTTIMNKLVEKLKRTNKKTLFLNLDLERDSRKLASQEKLISKIKLEFGDDSGFVFIDEIQRKENAGIFLKGLYDMNLPYKFIVSGSGNIEIKEKISESLVGRKRLFEMKVINFNEFVNFKTYYKYMDRLEQFFNIEKEKTEFFLLEYMNFGGYPKIVINTSIEEKYAEINEIYQSYVNQDIIKWLNVEKIESFERLVKISASQVGNLVDYSALASSTSLSVKTVHNYLWYLRKTFVLGRCKPFFKNKKKEIVKSPIFYFYDLGLRNYVMNEFGKIDSFSSNIGFIFENFIFNMLKEQVVTSNSKINFWRTKSKAEVDFVIDLGNDVIPIEAKFKSFKSPKIERSMKSFIKKYKPKKAFIVNRDFSKKIIFEDTEVIFCPFYSLTII